jgi:hypothetical protein
MTGIAPATRPELSGAAVREILKQLGVDLTKPALLGRRGYYRDTMGAVGRNDIGIYDDAIFLVTPLTFCPFNANTDPSRIAPGRATLIPGVWSYRLGIHGLTRPREQQYKALVQAGRVTVMRAGNPPRKDTGWFGINIHRGGNSTTSSEGCQTIHPSQWTQFITLVETEMKRCGVTTITYALTERADA